MSSSSIVRRGLASLAIAMLLAPTTAVAHAHATSESAEISASAHSLELTEEERASLIGEFASYGVNEEVAVGLLDKFQQGYLLDSMKPDAVPISSVKSVHGTEIEVIETYEDGSIVVSTVPNLDGIKNAATDNAIQLRSVSGCTFSSGGAYAGYWKNCVASENLIVVRMGFTFDYETIRDRGSRITGYRSYFHHIIGGSLSNFRFDRMSPTQVRLSADTSIEFEGIPAGWTAWMQVNVSGSKAWTTHN